MTGVFIGTPNGDIIFGAGLSQDTIFGAAGDDQITAGNEKKTIHAGKGNDTVYGSSGGDFLTGDLGDDLIYGGEGIDSIYGGKGSDTLHGGKGDDLISGGEGNDVLFGDEGSDTFGGLNVGDQISDYNPQFDKLIGDFFVEDGFVRAITAPTPAPTLSPSPTPIGGTMPVIPTIPPITVPKIPLVADQDILTGGVNVEATVRLGRGQSFNPSNGNSDKILTFPNRPRDSSDTVLITGVLESDDALLIPGNATTDKFKIVFFAQGSTLARLNPPFNGPEGSTFIYRLQPNGSNGLITAIVVGKVDENQIKIV